MTKRKRWLTAKWTVESQQDLDAFYELGFDRDLVWDAVHDIEDERGKRESARSSQSTRGS